jgi:hypothetical protein
MRKPISPRREHFGANAKRVERRGDGDDVSGEPLDAGVELLYLSGGRPWRDLVSSEYLFKLLLKPVAEDVPPAELLQSQPPHIRVLIHPRSGEAFSQLLTEVRDGLGRGSVRRNLRPRVQPL